MKVRCGEESEFLRAPKGLYIVDDWCDQQDWVADGDRIYRCKKCGKRLHPRERIIEGEHKGWQLPPHKKKGHRIRSIKLRQQKLRKGRSG